MTSSALRTRTSAWPAARASSRDWLSFAAAACAYGFISLRFAADYAAQLNDSKANGFVIVAAMASLYLLANAAFERSSRAVDWIAAALAIGMAVAGQAAGAIFGFGLFLTLTGARGSYRSAGGVIMLAVGLRVLWAPIILHAIAPVILPLDAALAYHIIAITNPAVTAVGTILMTSPDFGIDVQEPCSSFHNVSLGSLAFVTIAMLARRRFAPHDLTVLAGIAAAQIVLNVVRLALMAPNPQAFAFWHDGLGKEGMAALGTLLPIAMAMVGVPWATRMASASTGRSFAQPTPSRLRPPEWATLVKPKSRG